MLEKIRAMNKYKRSHFMQGLFHCCITALSLTLLISKSAWFHSLVSGVNAFFLVTLPDIGSYVIQPKIMFVVCNVIVIILVGESKCVSCPNPTSQSWDMYDEYVREKKAMRRQSCMQITEKLEVIQTENLISDNNTGIAHASHVEVSEKNKRLDDEMGDELETWEDAREEEEDDGRKGSQVVVRGVEDKEKSGTIPAVDELNTRIEAFLARVNEQRRMEAKLLAAGG